MGHLGVMEGLQSSGPVVAAVLLGLFVILIFLFNKKSDSTVSTTAVRSTVHLLAVTHIRWTMTCKIVPKSIPQKKAGTYGAGAVAKTKAAAGSGPFTEEEVAKHNTDEVPFGYCCFAKRLSFLFSPINALPIFFLR